MVGKCLKILAILGWVIFFTGCSQMQKETLSDKNWGRSYETAKFNQILNPDASKNLKPAVDLDGQAANNNVEKYRDYFKEKSSQETTNILKLQ
jgi:hypothetical protein